MLMPQIVKFLKDLDPLTCKAAEVRHLINERYGKHITYSQVAYELSKLKRKALNEGKKASTSLDAKKQVEMLSTDETPSFSVTLKLSKASARAHKKDSKVKSEAKSTVVVRSPQKCPSSASKPNSK